MKKKGFTLVELLATIVVLSVIALIAVPIVINVVEKAKKSALVSSVNGLVESANMYYTNEIIKGDISDNVIFDFEEGVQTSINKLSYKGKVYNGKLILTSDSDVITCIDDGKYYAYKEKNSDEIVSGIGTCLYDGTTGDFTIESDIDVVQKECESDKQELQDKIDELTDNVNNLETLINEKEYEISNLQATIDNLNNELITLRGEKEDLQNQLANSNTSNSELQEKINELNGTIATLESSIEAKNNEITVLNGEKADLQTALDTKTAELATLNENLGKVTATASDVLSGKTILTSSGLVTGSMTNNGSVSKSLNAGGSYTIPKGYHDGTGKVTANSLSSQTSATAVASNILSGKTAWVNGSKITGTMPNRACVAGGASGVVGLNNSNYSGVAVSPFDGALHWTENTDGVTRFSLQVPHGVYGGASNPSGLCGDGYVGIETTVFGNASANQVLSGAKFTSQNGLSVTGSMANKSGATVSATTVTESGTNALISIPANGYYDTNSKISVPIETIKNEIDILNNNINFLTSGNTSTTIQTTIGKYLLVSCAYPSGFTSGITNVNGAEIVISKSSSTTSWSINSALISNVYKATSESVTFTVSSGVTIIIYEI